MSDLIIPAGIIAVILAAIFGLGKRKHDYDVEEKKKKKDNLEEDMEEADDQLEDDFKENKDQAVDQSDRAPSDDDVESFIDRLRSRYGRNSGQE